MFTCNPLSGDPSMVAINASWGLGLAVVGGEVTPDDFLVRKVTREVVRDDDPTSTSNTSPIRPVGAPSASRFAELRRSRRAWMSRAARTRCSPRSAVEPYFGSRQDVEWAIARDPTLPERLFVLQSRPMTATTQAGRSRRGPQPPRPDDADARAVRREGAKD